MSFNCCSIAALTTTFQFSVRLHGKAAQEDTANIDTTVQEKNITYPTDGKLAIKVINHLNKLAKGHGIRQRRTYATAKRRKRCTWVFGIFAALNAERKPSGL